MPVSDFDIARSARLWIHQHGEHAIAKARDMVEEMRAKGDANGADTWLRIIASITTLGSPPTDARH
jgi:hypothetical protein